MRVIQNELLISNDCKIIKVAQAGAVRNETFLALKQLVEECENLYPGIDIWFKKKVVSGFRNSNRVGYVVYVSGRPAGAAIIRKGKNAKLCSLRVLNEHMNKGIGKLLMSVVAFEIRNTSSRMHFTLPESLWCEKRSFFEAYGFQVSGLASNQYRVWEQEFSCSSVLKSVLKKALSDLPQVMQEFRVKSSESSALLLSIKPNFAYEILSGRKKCEVRRVFSQKWKGAKAVLYASKPVRALVGEIVIDDVVVSAPEKVWSQWSAELGCTKEQFDNYCSDVPSVSILKVHPVRRYVHPLKLGEIRDLSPTKLYIPNSFCAMNSTAWLPTMIANDIIHSVV